MVVCVDIGGGTTRVGFSEDKLSFTNIEKFETFNEFEDLIERLTTVIKTKTSSPEKISIAAPGSIDRKNGIMVSWGQKQSWQGRSIFEPLRREFPTASLVIEHDADAGAIGEAYFGIAKEFQSFAYVTLSSGIGGALIEDKKPARASVNNEVGHQIINNNEVEKWRCGQKGCWEAYASGTAFQKIFKISPEECDIKEVWDQYAKYIASGLANIILMWRPNAILIGGGVSNKFNDFEIPLKEELSKSLGSYKNLNCEIVKSQLDEPGLYGGLVI